ncbi:PotD/PotF family extracellular solute-binding protein [Haladaptatus pallidirubidus]|nr:extracellular solute-binding protein [Haladaptatus pallidirubidus]
MLNSPKMGRRTFIKAAGAGSAASLSTLAGCLGGGNGGSKKSPMDIESWPPQDLENELVMWNWYDDWAAYAKTAFGKEFDVNITNSGFSSPNQWYSKLQGGNSEIDNISATANWVERSIENDFLHPLPVDKMPSWKNVTDRVKNVGTYQKEGKTYGVPESIVLYPLTYNTNHFDEAPSSWDVLWDDENKGKITMWDNSTVSCQIAALYTDQDPIDPGDFKEIEEVLKQQKPLLKTYWGDYQQGMSMFVNEEVVAGPLTMGRTYSAKFHENAPVNYTAPKEGALYTSDLFVIPKGAPHPMASLQFIDWASKKKHAAKLFTEMGYMPAVNIDEQLSQEQREFTNWPDSWKLVFQKQLSQEVRDKYSEIWTAVKSA